MKSYKLVAFIIIIFIQSPFIAFSAEVEGVDTNVEVTDKIYEWTPDGTIIQVGDYTITTIGDIYIDDGVGEYVSADKSALSVGGLVTARLVSTDKNRFWESEKIIVYTDKALEDQLALLSENETSDIANSDVEENDDTSKTMKSQSKKPRLIDGVWVN